MLSPVSVELNRTVPLLWVNAPAEFIHEPPTASVPLGNTAVPDWNLTVLVLVAFVSRNVLVAEPANVRLYASELPNRTECAVAEVNLSVPLLCVKVPPFFRYEPPIAKVPEGAVSVPAVRIVVRELVALALVNDHEPVPLNTRS